jgi:hypothetical protein
MQVTVIVNSRFHGFPPEGVDDFPVTLGFSNLWIWGSLQLGNPIPSKRVQTIIFPQMPEIAYPPF